MLKATARRQNISKLCHRLEQMIGQQKTLLPLSRAHQLMNTDENQ
jgi:hypothetical protein